jgi:AcrR family transcriptional regulator
MARTRDEGLEERLLDSAYRVFGEHGFQATTLREIAAGAGISSGSVYNYFPDKESLFRATVSRGWDGFIAELESISNGVALREDRIRELIDRGFGTLGPALPLIRGMLFDASRLNLLAPKVDRLCVAIETLVRPDEGDSGVAEWRRGATRRLLLIRILILGILCSAALLEPPSPEAAIAGLREAISAFLGETGLASETGLTSPDSPMDAKESA